MANDIEGFVRNLNEDDFHTLIEAVGERANEWALDHPWVRMGKAAAKLLVLASAGPISGAADEIEDAAREMRVALDRM